VGTTGVFNLGYPSVAADIADTDLHRSLAALSYSTLRGDGNGGLCQWQPRQDVQAGKGHLLTAALTTRLRNLPLFAWTKGLRNAKRAIFFKSRNAGFSGIKLGSR